MKAYLVYKDKSIKGFRRLLNSGGAIFDKYRAQASSFIRYSGNELDKTFSQYDQILDGLDKIHLEQVFPTNYRWLVSNNSLKTSREYLDSLEKRITEFEGGKEDNLKILVGTLFLKFVLITKIVETYLSVVSSFAENGTDLSKIQSMTLSDIGIGKQTLKYFDNLKDLSSKSIDDWLNYKADPVTSKYFYSSMKRIMTALVGKDS